MSVWKNYLILSLVCGGMICTTVIQSDENSWYSFLKLLFSTKPAADERTDQTNTHVDSSASLFQGKFAVGLQDHWQGVGFTISSSDPVNFPWKNLLPKYCKRAWYAWSFKNDASGTANTSPLCMIPLTVSADAKTTLVIGDVIKFDKETSVQIYKRMLQELVAVEKSRKQFSEIVFELGHASMLQADATNRQQVINIMKQLGFKLRHTPLKDLLVFNL